MALGNRVHFRAIGTGSIGKIFEHPGTVWAYELPVTDNITKPGNNYVMTQRIVNSFNI